MANLKEKLLGLMDNGVTQAMKLVDTIQETMNDIDWDEQFESLNSMKDSLIKKGNELIGDFTELVKQVKDNISDFEVTVPFDEAAGEKFESKIDGHKLTLEVTFKDEFTERSSKNVVTIPSNCDIEKMELKANAANKTMTVVIPKKLEESSDVNDIPASERRTDTVESKLLKKFRENIEKGSSKVTTDEPQKVEMPRGANGRFVKRKK